MSQQREESDRPGASYAWRRELRRGLSRLREGEFASAEHHFARAYRMAPDRPEVAYALGRERLRAGLIEEAEPLLRAAWAKEPSLLAAGAALARCLGLHLQRFDEAADVLCEVEARHGRSATVEVVRAELALERGRIEDARDAAQSAIALAEEEECETAVGAGRAALARVENQAGIERAGDGDLEAALFCFKRAADLDPEWSSPHVNLGAAFAGLGRARPARAAYERALALEPDNPAAYANLGRLYCERGELERALELVREAVILAPREADAWVDLAQVRLARGETADAEDCLRQAIDLEPGHPEACCRLADLLVRDGRYIEAATLAESAQTEDPSRSRLYLTGRLGVCSRPRPGTDQ